jgi:hypothetical protein
MARKYATYTDDFRAGCLLQVEAGGSLSAVAKQNRVPLSTLRGWVHRQQALDKMPKGKAVPAEIHSKKAIDFVQLIEAELEAIFGDMDIVRQDAGYRELGTVAGILFDKRQLLTGGPTENINQAIRVNWDERTGNHN